MRIESTRLTAALAAALAIATAPACKDDPDPPAESDTDTDADADTDTDTDADTDTDVPVEPTDLTTVCGDSSVLPHLTLADPADYLAVRRAEEFGGVQDVDTWGTPCATASDVPACEAALAALVPTSTGWGYCGEGCSDSGLLYTRGDEVGMADSPDEVVALLGSIDATGDVLFRVTTQEYTPVCDSVRRYADGRYSLTGVILTSDCPWTEETRALEVAPGGATTILEVLAVDEDDICAGRRPEGLTQGFEARTHPAGAHLAALARMEAAAVVAFERLADELGEHGAPTDLVDRARRAAADEVRHAELVGGLAEAHGCTPPPIEVANPRSRSLFEMATENAVEGCVRETFGVADAMYRARNAPTEALRQVFAEIARDELRHAVLSWDIAAWAAERLSDAENADIARRTTETWDALESALARSNRASLEALGAPASPVAAQMARELRSQLAA